MDDRFRSIRPYNDSEIGAVLRRLAKNRSLIGGIRNEVFPGLPKMLRRPADYFLRTTFLRKIGTIRTVEQFQRKITSGVVLDWIIKHTTNGLSFSGLENLDQDRPYVFVSNHRDIVLDSALLSYVVGNNGFGIPAIAFGDNLMINDVVSDLIRANKSFVVRRKLPFKEKVKAAYELSRYIWFLHEQGESVWIAQRAGRAKDGDDKTNPSLIKTLYMAQRKNGINFKEFIREINIVPVAVSYEKDPCDLLKAKELLEKAENNFPERKKHEDLEDMYMGLKGEKGRVHVALSRPLCGEYQREEEVAKDIDRSIHRIYRLWPTNYIAYDELEASKEYSAMYSYEERGDFLERFRQEREDIRRKALAMYAQPVINQRALDCSRD